MSVSFDFEIHGFVNHVNRTLPLETLTFYFWVLLEYPSLIASHWLSSSNIHAKMYDYFYFSLIFLHTDQNYEYLFGTDFICV
jgi:hypothetical protein